jgi:hypothetical protein
VRNPCIFSYAIERACEDFRTHLVFGAERGKSVKAAHAFCFALREFATISLALFAFACAWCGSSAGRAMLGGARPCVSGTTRGRLSCERRSQMVGFLLYVLRSSRFSGSGACEILHTHRLHNSFHTENKQLRACFAGEVFAFAGKT